MLKKPTKAIKQTRFFATAKKFKLYKKDQQLVNVNSWRVYVPRTREKNIYVGSSGRRIKAATYRKYERLYKELQATSNADIEKLPKWKQQAISYLYGKKDLPSFKKFEANTERAKKAKAAAKAAEKAANKPIKPIKPQKPSAGKERPKMPPGYYSDPIRKLVEEFAGMPLPEIPDDKFEEILEQLFGPQSSWDSPIWRFVVEYKIPLSNIHR